MPANQGQLKLDQILERNKAQPVGHGYIDVIVKREYVDKLLNELFESGFTLTAITWWEHVKREQTPSLGMGGPESKYFDGWFSEIAREYDELHEVEPGLMIEHVRELITSKQINSEFTFQKSNSLTPAIWIDVPESWRNAWYRDA